MSLLASVFHQIEQVLTLTHTFFHLLHLIIKPLDTFKEFSDILSHAAHSSLNKDKVKDSNEKQGISKPIESHKAEKTVIDDSHLKAFFPPPSK